MAERMWSIGGMKLRVKTENTNTARKTCSNAPMFTINPRQTDVGSNTDPSLSHHFTNAWRYVVVLINGSPFEICGWQSVSGTGSSPSIALCSFAANLSKPHGYFTCSQKLHIRHRVSWRVLYVSWKKQRLFTNTATNECFHNRGSKCLLRRKT